MKVLKIIIIVMTSSFFCSGCGYGLYFVKVDPGEEVTTPITKKDESKHDGILTSRYYATIETQSPVLLAHADIDKKKIYITSF